MTHPSVSNDTPKKWPSAKTWTREQIRAARMAALEPLLRKRGLELIEREAHMRDAYREKSVTL